MSEVQRNIIVWAPRVLGLFFAGFLSLFALDAFDGQQGVWKNLAAFAIHLIPAATVLAATVAGCRWPLVGVATFGGLAAWYAARVYAEHPQWILPIAVPAVVIALLFAASWWLNRPVRRLVL